MKKKQKNKLHNPDQRSFYFEDYLETNRLNQQKNKSKISEDRLYIIFFVFISLIFIFSVKIISISLQKPQLSNNQKNLDYFVPSRRDIVDRNGVLISRNIGSFHAAVRTNLVKDKKKFLLKIKILFPELNHSDIKKKLEKKKYFYLKKRITEDERKKLWSLGEKSIIFEPFQTRIYPQSDLYSHVLGQIDNDNYGISGLEKSLDRELKDKKKINLPLKISMDTNLQYIVQSELYKSIKVFNAKGAAGLLMDSENGEILSLVSLPNFDINKRQKITDKNYNNKVTNSVFELGSIFKTFTVALAIEKKIVEPKTIIQNIPKKIKCSTHEISDIKEFPNTLTVEDILIRSSNVGTLKIARKIGKDDLKHFLNELNLLKKLKFDIEEIGTPHKFSWNKCKLETVSFGRGITTTPLQASAAYASLINGGNLINPTLLIVEKKELNKKKVISEETSKKVSNILRKVVSDQNGTASLSDVFGYQVSGKTGTSQYYENKEKNTNTFISVFLANKKKYILFVMLEDPQAAKDLVYNYRGLKIKSNRNEAGWNTVYAAGKIIEQIGPILAINKNTLSDSYVVEKLD